MSNLALKRIHQILGNLVQTCNITQCYVDKDDLWSGILAAAEFTIFSTTNRMKFYIPFQLVFGSDVILMKKHTMYWGLICQKNKTQLNK